MNRPWPDAEQHEPPHEVRQREPDRQRREAEQRHDHHDHPGARRDRRAPAVRGRPAERRHDRHRDRHRREEQAGLDRRVALPALEQERQQEGRREQAGEGDDDAREAERERPDAEQREVDQGLRPTRARPARTGRRVRRRARSARAWPGWSSPTTGPRDRASSRANSEAARERRAPQVEGLAHARPSRRAARGPPTAIARTPTGMLMRKIARHDAVVVSSPPSTGPRVRPSETLTPLSPSARPRSPARNVRAMIAGPIAVIIAAPTAWTTRKRDQRRLVGGHAAQGARRP